MNDFDKAIEFINIAEEYLKGEVNAITLAALLQKEVDKAEKAMVKPSKSGLSEFLDKLGL